jgi:hypothetical protein
MSVLFFTLCSNNYLPSALALGGSIRRFLPEARFIIGLVDQQDAQIDYSSFSDFEVIPCFELGYPEFEDMLVRYNIIEFNTAVKPFYFKYLFEKHPEADRIYYIDPDILFYQSPEVLDQEWAEEEILLTPNLIYTTPKPSTGELASLRHGMYNLGFIGLKRGIESFRLIVWWKERLKDHCRIDKCNGIFVDQKWMDLAPLFFDKIKIAKHPGLNMAWWNLSERKLLKTESGYAVNDPDIPLVFFHFSGFKPDHSQLTERLKSDEFRMESDGLMKKLFEGYKELLLRNGYERMSKIKPLLKFRTEPNTLWIRIGKKIKSKSSNAIFRIFKVR